MMIQVGSTRAVQVRPCIEFPSPTGIMPARADQPDANPQLKPRHRVSNSTGSVDPDDAKNAHSSLLFQYEVNNEAFGVGAEGMCAHVGGVWSFLVVDFTAPGAYREHGHEFGIQRQRLGG